MNALTITPDALVDDILRSLPQARRLFLTLHADCIGCGLGRFCTLEEAARLGR